MDRMLQSQGFGTRRHCQQLVAEAHVRVAGELVDDPARLVETAGLAFTVFDEPWLYRERVYLALNKPPGYECSRRPSHHPAVLSLLPEPLRQRDVQPVGRLDHDTTGLLLLSDDGAFIHAQSSPKRRVGKLYVADTAEPVTPALVAALLGGVQLHDEPAPLAAVRCEQLDACRIAIELEQGKYHQVKRMLAAAGNHCVALRRVAIGGLELDALALAEGQWCYLGERELEQLAAG
ncbi:ribosomal small subunit pseudouridine synthase A [mine drainage metagenome]|uniref:Ribosomal small subunit pseudouridine synthase A n=1 Tax=mine drainage metagenome TaxID=410659 RepID=A0A1J5QWQ5_9ZZZZ